MVPTISPRCVRKGKVSNCSSGSRHTKQVANSTVFAMGQRASVSPIIRHSAQAVVAHCICISQHLQVRLCQDHLIARRGFTTATLVFNLPKSMCPSHGVFKRALVESVDWLLVSIKRYNVVGFGCVTFADPRIRTNIAIDTNLQT